VQLQWATYFDAADEAGASRRWGGLHPAVDDLPGRIIGAQCGQRAWELARQYWDGSIAQRVGTPQLRRTGPASIELTWDAAPGMWYRVFRTSDFASWHLVAASVQATDTRFAWTDTTANQPRYFYRVVQQPAP
jgi:hypothetical protein